MRSSLSDSIIIFLPVLCCPLLPVMELNPDHSAYFYVLFFTIVFHLFIWGVQGRKPLPTRLEYYMGENAISISLDGLDDRLSLIGPNGSGKIPSALPAVKILTERSSVPGVERNIWIILKENCSVRKVWHLMHNMIFLCIKDKGGRLWEQHLIYL